jgi:flagellum-specific ATP synthase
LIPDIARCKETARSASRPFFRGSVDVVSGIMIEAGGVPAALGELCRIDRGRDGFTDAEVVGFRGSSTLLMPHGELQGIAPSQPVYALGRPFELEVSRSMLGRMIDGFGAPLDGGPPLEQGQRRSVRRKAPVPMDREPIREPLQTGVRVLDGLNTIGRGQRIGIFAGSGVGKSTLLGQITRGTSAGIVVCCLVGERGREVRDFVDDVLGDEGKGKAVMVVATSDRSPIERFLAPFVAVTVAEFFRDQGEDVLLVMDSVTRFAAASREIGLAAGEPPTVRGYPPSFFATVPKLVERMGRTKEGSITGLLTVLLDGDDPNEPVSDTVRGLLDGHLFMTRDLAQRGHFPAVDVLDSLSRLMPSLVDQGHMAFATMIREALAVYKEGRDLIEIGAYRAGSNPRLDRAIQLMPKIEAFLRQPTDHLSSLEETMRELAAIVPAAAGSAGA